MNNNLLFFLDLDDRTLFSNSIRSFFGFISKFIYKLFSGAIDLMYQLAAFDFGMNDFIETVSGRLFSILIIFMIFKVSISIMSYLVNPDVAIDKDKGFQSIIKRVIISIILLISINPIFVVLKEVESAIIEDDIITTIFTTSDDEKVITAGKERIVGVRMSPHCPSNKMIYTATKGDRIALLLFRPFLQPYGEDDITDPKVDNGQKAWDTVFSPNEGKDMAHYCGYDISSVKEIVLNLSGVDFKESFRDAIPGPNSAEGLLRDYYYNLGINEADTGYSGNGDGVTSQYFFEFDYFFAFVLGIVGLLIVISFCFDVIIRSLNFIILQMIAPIPIISYVSPQGKSKEMLSAWWKKVISVWASLFIRILCLSLAILIIDGACNSLDNNDFGNASLLMQIFIILGVLMFAKKLPKFLEEIIPGLKLDGGFELNPFKRIQKDALGSKQLIGLGASALGAGLSGITNFAQRGIEGIIDINKNGLSGRRLLRHAAKTAGSTIAGATRGGVNAFGRAYKDGKLISGAWNGYQTSMFSKKLREDNLRKAGLADAGLIERAKFGIGSMTSDLARYAGVLNKGQREDLIAAEEDTYIKQRQDELDLQKYNLSQEKYKALEPYQQYATLATKIKARIDNSKDVKDAEKNLENARATGDYKKIKRAEMMVDATKNLVANSLYKNDLDVKDMVDRMNKLRDNNEELKQNTIEAFEYNAQAQRYEFKSQSIYKTQNHASIIEREFEEKERILKNEQEKINEQKRNFANDEAHNPMSQAKLQNASRMNNKPEDPGFKATPNQSSQATIQDNSMFNNLGPNGNNGGPVPPPPPPGGRH